MRRRRSRRSARHVDAANAQVGFDMSHGQGQHRVGIEFEHAERRSRELRERWCESGLRLEREQRRVGQHTTRVVDEILRRVDRQLGVLGERRFELDRRDRCRVVVGIEGRLPGQRLAIVDIAQHEALGRRPRDRGRELESDRSHRRACGLRVLAFAREARGEVGAHGEREATFGAGHDLGSRRAARRRDATAPHELDLRVVRQASLTREHRDAIGMRAEREALEQLLAIVAVDDAHADPFADARDLAPRVGRHAGRRGRSVEHQHEDLLFIDAGTALAGRREIADDGRAAGREREGRLADDRAPVARLRVGLQGEAATNAGSDVFGEVVDPGAIVDPATRAGGRTLHVERRRQLRVAEVDHRRAERRSRLTNVRDFALRRELTDGHRHRGRLGRCGPRILGRAVDEETREEAGGEGACPGDDRSGATRVNDDHPGSSTTLRLVRHATPSILSGIVP